MDGECDSLYNHNKDCLDCSFYYQGNINDRRLMLKMERDIKCIIVPMYQNPITPTRRLMITGAVSNYLNALLHRRGIREYRVVCDETNNTTPNQTTVDVYIKAPRRVETIVINFMIQ